VILPHYVELGENKEFCMKTFTDISQNSTVFSLATIQRYGRKRKKLLKYEIQNWKTDPVKVYNVNET